MKALALLFILAGAMQAPSQKIPPHKAAIVLFDGKSLGNFDTFIKSKGLNSDPDHVFKLEDGMIHVSGKEMGYLITHQSFHDFYLRGRIQMGRGHVRRARRQST